MVPPGSGPPRKEATRTDGRKSALRDPAIVDRILAGYGARPGLKPILDAPCGTGRLRGVFERRGMRYVGVDVSWPMLCEARRGEGTGLVMAVVDRMPFRDDAFDVVLCCRLLHHLEENEEAEVVVRELVRVAHRMIIVSFFDPASLHALRRKMGLRRAEGSRRRRALSKRSLKRMFDAAGADIIGFHHSLRFVSQQAFAVALKRATVGEGAREAEARSAKLLALPGAQVEGSLGSV